MPHLTTDGGIKLYYEEVGSGNPNNFHSRNSPDALVVHTHSTGD